MTDNGNGSEKNGGMRFGLQQLITLISVASTTAVGAAVTMAKLGGDMRMTNQKVDGVQLEMRQQFHSVTSDMKEIREKVNELDKSMAVFEDREKRRDDDPTTPP